MSICGADLPDKTHMSYGVIFLTIWLPVIRPLQWKYHTLKLTAKSAGTADVMIDGQIYRVTMMLYQYTGAPAVNGGGSLSFADADQVSGYT